MAIGTPSESPAIIVKELDRSGVVPKVKPKQAPLEAILTGVL